MPMYLHLLHRLRTNHRSSYIPQKEKALKIYTDHNPNPASPENAEKWEQILVPDKSQDRHKSGWGFEIF